jgi:hypothetical protein
MLDADLCFMLLHAWCCSIHYAAQSFYVDPSFLLLHTACRSILYSAGCSMLFRSVSRFVFYTYSFLILLALYVVPSLMFLRALSCFMFNALLFHSVCRSVLNDISGCMQMHGLCYTFRDIARAWCHSILYVFLCYILLRLLCCPIVDVTPFFAYK